MIILITMNLEFEWRIHCKLILIKLINNVIMWKINSKFLYNGGLILENVNIIRMNILQNHMCIYNAPVYYTKQDIILNGQKQHMHNSALFQYYFAF